MEIHFSQFWRSEVGARAWLCSGEGPVPGSQLALSRRVLTRRKGLESSAGSHQYTGTNPKVTSPRRLIGDPSLCLPTKIDS